MLKPWKSPTRLNMISPSFLYLRNKSFTKRTRIHSYRRLMNLQEDFIKFFSDHNLLIPLFRSPRFLMSSINKLGINKEVAWKTWPQILKSRHSLLYHNIWETLGSLQKILRIGFRLKRMSKTVMLLQCIREHPGCIEGNFIFDSYLDVIQDSILLKHLNKSGQWPL